MFVRVKTTPNSPRKSVQIVQSIRDGDKVKQKIVRHVGIALNDFELEKLKDLGEYIKANIENEIKPMLYQPEELAEAAIEARKKKDDEKEIKVNLRNLEEEQRVTSGIHEVYGDLFSELKFDELFDDKKKKAQNIRLLKNIVMARIANPKSKRGSVMMLENDFGIKLNLDHVYQMMDRVDDDVIDKIQQRSFDATYGLFKEKLDVLFYDCTTLYFESFTEDELKENGFSKDNKFNQPQVLLSIIVSKHGLPVGYDLFPGSTYEGHTLQNAIDSLKKRFSIDKIVFVADAGMLNKDNLTMLENNNLEYIVGARLKNMKASLHPEITDLATYRDTDSDLSYKSIKLDDGKNLILSYSRKRAKKDAFDREKNITKLSKKLKRLKNPKEYLSNFGYKKFLKVEGDAKIELDEAKIADARKWDGIHGMITNIDNPDPATIKSHYAGLWQVEESFRVSKHDLKIRPIFHWTPAKIKAHIAIVFIALCLVRHLEYRVAIQQRKMSAEVIRNALLHVQLSILKDKWGGARYVVPSKMSEDARTIYKVTGKTYSMTPYRL